MFHHILVPLDLTGKNAAAIACAADLAAAGGGTITLLHVVEVVEGIPAAELKAFYKKLETRAAARLAAIAKKLRRRPGIAAVEARVVIGRRVEEILAHARAGGTDLVVLSSHKIDLERGTGAWGTISQKVGILAPCPVLLVR
jgi:nucleotide-binding universal stress UspA family protein